MDAVGLPYQRQENCFVWIEDFGRAQALMEEQLTVNGPAVLGGVAQTLNPLHEEIFQAFPVHYYWSVPQSEWATDIVFDDPAVRRRLYPMFIRHGMGALHSPDVMRFLGHRLNQNQTIPAKFNQEVVSDIKIRALQTGASKERQEGVRIKHRTDQNSVQGYDKAYTPTNSVFRVETTLNNERNFKVYRSKEGDREGPKTWRYLRRGIADLHRRAEVSQKANERYLEALASVDDSATLEEFTHKVTSATTFRDQRVRALKPFDPEDLALMEAVSRGEFTINGLRNRDLQRCLFPTEPSSPEEAKRRSALVSRKLRLLRAHGILSKVPHTHRYQVTSWGRRFLTALLTARHTPIHQLLPQAA